MHTVAHNLKAAPLDTIERVEEANRQSVGYMDETPYAETFYFKDGSELTFDWHTGKFTAHAKGE